MVFCHSIFVFQQEKKIISIVFVSLFAFSLSYGKTSGYNELKNAYYGDTHVHTAASFDSYPFGNRNLPEDAYKFAKGKTVNHTSGRKFKRSFPLDFLAVTDHSEYLGLTIMSKADLKKYGFDKNKEIAELRGKDFPTAMKIYAKLNASFAVGKGYSDWDNKTVSQDVWKKVIATANKYYKPGKFTTFAGYEWTSHPNNYNLHRIVLFKNKAADYMFSSFDSMKPEDLWTYLEAQRKKGIEVMAIPHNANLSNGLMFDDKDSYGKKITKAYAKRRALNEPLHEMLQLKGNSETHPAFAKNDEFANFELYNFQLTTGKRLPPKRGSYVREGYKKGLKYQQKLGANPYAFGIFGGSDTHIGLPSPQEFKFGGGHGHNDDSAKLRLHSDNDFADPIKISASSVSGVWAEENTRESIWAAMERKETFVTSGTRIKVRFFGSTKYNKKQAMSSNWISYGYKNGVPMGGVVKTAKKAPSFIVWAIKDPNGANLDRIQIVKGWVDKNGKTHEKIYNVAWSDMKKRKMTKNGKIPAVGNTVDLKTAKYKNTIGAKELKAFWTDPNFDPAQNAFYYPRVLEIPTPRWSLYDAVALKDKELTKKVSPTIQERAWASPIWFYTK